MFVVLIPRHLLCFLRKEYGGSRLLVDVLVYRIRKNGVSSTVILNDKIWPNCTSGRSDAQLLRSIELYMLSMACILECTRSETELACGRCGVVRVFMYASMLGTW